MSQSQQPCTGTVEPRYLHRLVRRRVPKMLPGKIRFAWAHSKEDGADWFSVSQVPADTGTRNYILCELSRIGEELVRRGYDRASIRFECAKPNA